MPTGHRFAAGPRFVLVVVALATAAGVNAPARVLAAEAGETFDDPKLARELPPAPPSAAASGIQASKVPPAPPKAPATAPANGSDSTVAAIPKAPSAPAPPAAVPAPTPAPTLAPTTPPVAVAPPALPGPVALPVAPAVTSPPSPPPSPAATTEESPAPPAVAAPSEAVPAQASPSPEPVTSAPSPANVDLAVKAKPPEPPAPVAAGPWPYAPRFKLAYRHFSFLRMPVSGSAAASPSESFESLSLDAYPTSTYLRVGLSTQFGWESGQFQRTGDYFIAESMTTGFQIPGRFTPFLEGLAGAGYMRRMQAGSSSPTGYWQLGVDGGVEIYFAKRAYFSVAVGYLHPGNLFLQQKNLTGINSDTWSLKVGVGI